MLARAGVVSIIVLLFAPTPALWPASAFVQDPAILLVMDAPTSMARDAGVGLAP